MVLGRVAFPAGRADRLRGIFPEGTVEQSIDGEGDLDRMMGGADCPG